MGTNMQQYLTLTSYPQFLSHDQACIESNIHDPLIQRSATLRAIDDMLSRGDILVAENFKNWPKGLPVRTCPLPPNFSLSYIATY